ncbi:hypothetical protein G7085_08550 [Tessaracoccus sp. HDW20]|uniref:hypothetical protein n=1 Tax=Tessaracoccus coleopterorum TaxID=2714950 RepID=UPI0018D3094F|nr:hypothetical protein [Tessaracoccus coleopterorum]NHB84641.1 hypothetical protein [Tessaracoccus coleopterorum]
MSIERPNRRDMSRTMGATWVATRATTRRAAVQAIARRGRCHTFRYIRSWRFASLRLARSSP